MLDRVPETLQSRGRIYTSERQRRKIDATDKPYGRGTPIDVGVIVTDKSPEWGSLGTMATFDTELGYYGEITIPQEVRQSLGLAEGDNCLLTVVNES